MIWQNPLAWVGLAAIAVPMAVHLLARRHAVRVRFPTLRFLPVAPSSAVRRHRVSDLVLLTVRAAVVATSVAALAQPYLETAGRARDADSTHARAIVIDTSPSMERLTTDQRRGVEAARRTAVGLEPHASATRTVESLQLQDGIRAASIWLSGRAGHRELVVVSDFQLGALGPTDLAMVPADAGIRLIKVAVATPALVEGPLIRVGGHTVRARATVTADATQVVWESTPSAVVRSEGLRVLVGPSDESLIDAAFDAAVAGGVPATPPARPVTVVFPTSAERNALVAGAQPIDVAWMFDTVDRLRRDRTLIDAAAFEHRAPEQTGAIAPPPFAVVTRGAGGGSLLLAARGQHAGTAMLLLLPTSSSGVFPAALLRSVMRAAADTTSLAEREPLSLPADVLSRWERLPARAAASGPLRGGESDGRWLWGVALVLLGLESWMRRAPSQALGREAVHDGTA